MVDIVQEPFMLIHRTTDNLIHVKDFHLNFLICFDHT